MYRAYKFRLYPTPKQKSDLNQNFGNCRFVFNYYLSIIKDNNFANISNCIKNFNNKLKIENQFLQKTDSQILIKSIYNLNDSYKKNYQTEGHTTKYKSKYAKNSYTIKNSYINYQTNHQTIELDLENKTITLSNLEKIKIKGYRKIKKITGKIVNATISKELTGKYYVSILFEQPNLSKESFPTSIVGIDLGIKKLLTLSNGTTYNNNKYIEKYEKRIKRCQKELSRKEKGSKNYYKCKKKLAILYSKLKNARKYYIHKITKNITNSYAIAF